jgi:TolA-binding protein
VQVAELEEQLSQMAKQAASMQMDKERLLSMVSRLELDKHRLEAERAASTSTSQTGGSAQGSSDRCESACQAS